MTDTKNNPIQLTKFLKELAKINSKSITHVRDYDNIIWLHEIPEVKVFSHVRNWDTDSDENLIISVRKKKESDLPPIPDLCKPWVNFQTLKQTDDYPKLLEEIITTTDEKYNLSTGNVLHLSDFPNVSERWEKYITDMWDCWRDDTEQCKKINLNYSKLYSIYQEQQKENEKYELFLCYGLLNWTLPNNGQIIKHHIVSIKVELMLEPHLSRFDLILSNDNKIINISLDMLDQYQPSNIKELLDFMEDNINQAPLLKQIIDKELNKLANLLSSKGEYYSDSFFPSKERSDDKLTIEFAPALILKERSTNGIINCLDIMLTQINSQVQLSDSFAKLCEIRHDNTKSQYTSDGTVSNLDNELYFPLLYNDEQQKIIFSSERQNAVLVQGPPGTGKSHTIANLVSHLLANGQRILITAKTPRALQVLFDKLPTNINPLCINYLGNSIDEKKALENSVSGILKEYTNASHDRNKDINKLIAKLTSLRSQKSQLNNKIKSLREIETDSTNIIADGSYRGTAAQIAKLLLTETDKYSWFIDSIQEETRICIDNTDIQFLSNYLSEIAPEKENELIQFIPEIKSLLPSMEEIKTLFDNYKMSKTKYDSFKDIVIQKDSNQLVNTIQDFGNQLLDLIHPVVNAIDNIMLHNLSWVNQAIGDILLNRVALWQVLYKETLENTNNSIDLLEQIRDCSVQIPQEYNRMQVLQDAKVLKTYLEQGNKINILLFKPVAIRKAAWFTKQVRVNGNKCINLKFVDILIDSLTLQKRTDRLIQLWTPFDMQGITSIDLLITNAMENNNLLKQILELNNSIAYIRKLLSEKNADQLIKHLCDINSIKKIEELCKISVSKQKLEFSSKALNAIQKKLEDLENFNNPHPIIKLMIEHFQMQDMNFLNEDFNLCVSLFDLSVKLKRKNDILIRLSSQAPGTVKLILNNEIWSNNIKNLEHAWNWARAISWLNKFIKDDIPSLELKLSSIESEIRETMKELVAQKAWDNFLKRMNDSHRQNLIAWQDAIKKLGKGTGKYAEKHRKSAQEFLMRLIDVIPAWILPLYRVYDTAKIDSQLFDIIIIDEASQCGFEALPLFYLSKKVLIVGDDKQISPESVGIDQSRFFNLRDYYLKDFDYKNTFNINTSLYDYSNRLFSDPIRLREHFRCMPEIIRFSNNLCYFDEPLIPLKQYPPDRLEPIKTVYVENGFRKGQDTRIINELEANEIVKTIVSCCRNKRYNKLTMGVITLQGHAQDGYISGLLAKELDISEIKERRLICGNPYAFQGDERDIVFLSMVATPDVRIGTLVKPEDERRFNVAASRAKEQMWLFHSVKPTELGKDCYRRKLLEYCLNPNAANLNEHGIDIEDLIYKSKNTDRDNLNHPRPFDSWFEVDVFLTIIRKGYKAIPQYKSGGKKIDIVVQFEQRQMAVECDGDHCHGLEELEADMARERKLRDLGWIFFRIRESQYYANPITALDKLWLMLDELKIYPKSKDTTDFKKSDSIDDFCVNKDISNENNQETKLQKIKPIKKSEISDTEQLSFFGFENEYPKSIKEAQKIDNNFLNNQIIAILTDRPNNSCMQNKLGKEILKIWGIRTYGQPLKDFNKKVDRLLFKMHNQGIVELYKSKNERVRLIKES